MTSMTSMTSMTWNSCKCTTIKSSSLNTGTSIRMTVYYEIIGCYTRICKYSPIKMTRCTWWTISSCCIIIINRGGRSDCLSKWNCIRSRTDIASTSMGWSIRSRNHTHHTHSDNTHLEYIFFRDFSTLIRKKTLKFLFKFWNGFFIVFRHMRKL